MPAVHLSREPTAFSNSSNSMPFPSWASTREFPNGLHAKIFDYCFHLIKFSENFGELRVAQSATQPHMNHVRPQKLYMISGYRLWSAVFNSPTSTISSSLKRRCSEASSLNACLSHPAITVKKVAVESIFFPYSFLSAFIADLRIFLTLVHNSPAPSFTGAVLGFFFADFLAAVAAIVFAIENTNYPLRLSIMPPLHAVLNERYNYS